MPTARATGAFRACTPRLRRDQGQIFLIDLGSTNGTRLNGALVPAHQAAAVADGDEIRLGKLLLRINFIP